MAALKERGVTAQEIQTSGAVTEAITVTAAAPVIESGAQRSTFRVAVVFELR